VRKSLTNYSRTPRALAPPASGELTLETTPVVRSDCDLTLGAIGHKEWPDGGTPRSLRRGFMLTAIASLAVGRRRQCKRRSGLASRATNAVTIAD
jgi:hypothetical protein